jgi:hypothetical protein
MKRKLIRIILSAVLLVALFLTVTAPAYAGDGQKQKAHGAGKNYSDFSNIGYPEIGGLEAFITFHFEAPGEGYYDYRCTSGTYEGSWAHTEIMGLFFGTYQGDPAVYFWGQVTAGENFFSGESPVDFAIPPYQNLEGWYKVGVFVDGGVPGQYKDFQIGMQEIPPLWVAPDGNTYPGDVAVKYFFDLMTVSGVDPEKDLGGMIGILFTGNINVK